MANHIIISKKTNGNVIVDNSKTIKRSLKPNAEVVRDKNGISVSVISWDGRESQSFSYSDVLKVVRADGVEVLINDQETLFNELIENFFFLNVNQSQGWDGRVSTRNELPTTIPPIAGAIYLVEFPITQTVLGVPYKTYQSGFYIRDTENGNLNDWRRLNVKVRFTTAEFGLVDPVDTGKQMGFDVSAGTSGTYRTHTLQNKNGILAHLSDLPPTVKGHRHIYFPLLNNVNTVINATNVPVKIAGNTIFGFGTSGWDMPTSNRITNNTGVTKRVKVEGNVSIQKNGVGAALSFTVYIAQTGAMLLGSKQASRAGNNELNNITLNWIGDVADGQYFELWIENNVDTDDVIVRDLSLIVTEL